MPVTQQRGKQIAPLDLTVEVTGLLPPANGGTGVNSLASALTAMLPSQTSKAGYFLQTSGSGVLWTLLQASGIDTTTSGKTIQDLLDDLASLIAQKMPVIYRTWNGTSWSSRPTTIPAGVPCLAFSTWDINCITAPPNDVAGDIWFYHPDAAVV